MKFLADFEFYLLPKRSNPVLGGDKIRKMQKFRKKRLESLFFYSLKANEGRSRLYLPTRAKSRL